MNNLKAWIPLLLNLMVFSTGTAFCQNGMAAKEIIEKANQNMEGESSVSSMSMSIIRPDWQRTLEFKNWVKGNEYALTLVTAPAKEKGQTFLKRGSDMWNYLPGIGRMIKLPPSMMSQGWMGSDYSNDDVLNETSLTEDFEQTFKAEETLENRECHVIELVPKEESNVVWGKIKVWVSKQDFLFMKYEYYDEDGFLVRTEKLGEIKTMDGRLIPTLFEIIPADEPNQKTLVRILEMDFNVDLEDDFFSQQNMKRIR